MANLLLYRLLWEPLPERLPSAEHGRLRRLRNLIAPIVSEAPVLSTQERVDPSVRRGAVQALVREAYWVTLAEQDATHRGPDAFARAWKAHLTSLLDQDSVDLPGWGKLIPADLDMELAWRLYELASRARQQAIDRAAATPSRRIPLGRQQTSTFEFAMVSDGTELGDVTYGVCRTCRVGLLYKIEFPTDWQFCGLGRLALGQLEARHPNLTWYTTGQFQEARGFYDQYRQGSHSPWTTRQYPCPHYKKPGPPHRRALW